MKYDDKYTVKWTLVEGIDESNLKSFSYATITITELFSIGHIIFDKPLSIDVYLPDEADKASDMDYALAVYDFGMEDKISIKVEKNWLHNYSGDNPNVEPIKTVFSTIKFDLMHAFFHYNGDPNYNHTHWALFGNLKERVEINEFDGGGELIEK